MSEATITDITATGGRLEATVSVPREIRRFFTGDPFWAEYPMDIESVPESILTIPVLAHVAPVAWTRNIDVHVETLDIEFLRALPIIRDALQEMYPDVIQGGQIVVDDPVSAAPTEGGGTGQVFTGGIDSLATYVRHQDEAPSLITINGWTEPVDDELWEQRKEMLRTYGSYFEVDNLFVRSNMLRFIDHTMLIAHFKRYVLGSWYSAVGSGLGLLGICAPLAYRAGMEKLYIASSVSPKREHAWGSHPDIDNHIDWTGTEVIHDAYPISRQEKVELLVEFAEESWPDMPIRTCNALVDANCGECEKCSRTAASLVLAGRDPNRHGYEFGPENWDDIRENLLAGTWDLQSAWVNWGDIKDHVDLDQEFPIDGAEAFFEWLAETDMEMLRDLTGPTVGDRLLRAIARNTPYPIYGELYPMYLQQVKSRSR